MLEAFNECLRLRSVSRLYVLQHPFRSPRVLGNHVRERSSFDFRTPISFCSQSQLASARARCSLKFRGPLAFEMSPRALRISPVASEKADPFVALAVLLGVPSLLPAVTLLSAFFNAWTKSDEGSARLAGGEPTAKPAQPAPAKARCVVVRHLKIPRVGTGMTPQVGHS